MKLKINQFSLCKKDRRDNSFELELPQVTLLRKHQKLLDIEDRVHDKQAGAIAEAVTKGMISVIKQVKSDSPQVSGNLEVQTCTISPWSKGPDESGSK